MPKLKAVMFFRIQGGIPPNISRETLFIDDSGKLCVKTFATPVYISNPEHAYRWVVKRSKDMADNFVNIAGKNMSIVRIVAPFWLCALFYRKAIDNKNPFNLKNVHICDISMSGVSFGLKDRWLELLCEAVLYADKIILDKPERIGETLNSCFITGSFPQRRYDRDKIARLLRKLDLNQEDLRLLKDCDPALALELETLQTVQKTEEEKKTRRNTDNTDVKM